MKLILNQKELKYIILNNIYYNANEITNIEIDGINVYIVIKEQVIEGTIYHLKYVFEK